jgi:hypothetical protein
MMSDFECLPVGTAARLAELEAENASLVGLLKDIPPFEAECEECFDKRHLLEAEVERLRALLQALRNEIHVADIGDWDLIDRIDSTLKEGQR